MMRTSIHRHRRPRRSRLGLTLLEAVFSVLVLSTGVVGVFGMMNRISNANRSMAFQALALDSFARIAAEIRDAQCIYAAENPADMAQASVDPGITVPANVWQLVAVNGSSIRHIGPFDDTNPPIAVAYRVTPDANVSATGAPAFDIDVRVRQVMHNAAQDNPALDNGYWIQIFPVKKMCALRADPTARGEY